MSYQKPRNQHDYKDLIWSLVPLVLGALLIAGVARACTFTADGPTPGQIPSIDAKATLEGDARTMGFPIRMPALPEQWRPNSANKKKTIDGAGGGNISTIGYISPEGTYMQLTQTNATEDALAREIIGSRIATGTEQIGDRKWVVYAEPGTEPSWITDYGTVRVLIKGAGNAATFNTLATAVGQAQPLPTT
ncbi:DUF4245 domain-containing protein [Nocardia huaxiensis]|uniref:DUF4245 domain-containing protein n=1 Tax=Nocardia huaxiensis TaxID=2755382 RepID=A0A7D6ZDA0_9NOCA|nr:DUF4245 domain-containing protein [Nocardia huaxiensis]QLY32728.1 DUF4245 domain-containing protein [Nocardia huaxiensis]UFS93537.1 DUF4245 domain-containing protein [Nocardia huaxiensis]